jgi:short-subunit dehydrogenase
VSSKVALLQMCESTARALASDPKSRHVSCHIIMPGVVQTQFAASSVRAQNLHQASCTSEAALNPSAPAPNSGSFAGDDASKHVFGHMMSLGLLPGQIAQQVFERLAWDNAFMIVCDNSPAIDLAKALDERARALLSGAVPAVDVPPIVLEARRRAGL